MRVCVVRVQGQTILVGLHCRVSIARVFERERTVKQ